MRVTRKYIEKLILEELQDFEPAGHPLVIKANAKLHEAYIAIEELTELIFEEGLSSEMLRGKTTVHDIDNKIRRLYHQERSYLSTKE